MDYYRQALSLAVFQLALSQPDWAPCSTLADPVNVAVLAAHQEEAIALAHQQRQPQHQPQHSNALTVVLVPSNPMARDISPINSNCSLPHAPNRPSTCFPFSFYQELFQYCGVCWCFQKSFNNIHQSNKASGKQICPNVAVSASNMDVFCVSCTSTTPSPTPSSLTPIQSIASAYALSTPLPLTPAVSSTPATLVCALFLPSSHL